METLKAALAEKDELLALRSDGHDVNVYKNEMEEMRKRNENMRSQVLKLVVQINDIREDRVEGEGEGVG